MKKFYISENLSTALGKQESTLLVTTAASTVGWLFVKGVQLVTQTAAEPVEMPPTPGIDFSEPEGK